MNQKVICFANMKGGVGKTTLCVNLAFELFLLRKKVLLIDNDPQFNATCALLDPDFYISNCIKTQKYNTIYDIYEKPPRIRGRKAEKIDPRNLTIKTWYMTTGDGYLHLIPSRIELYSTLKNPSQKEYLLDKFIKKMHKNMITF